MSAEHDAIVNDWRKNAARHDEANFRFLRSLKMVHDQDRIDDLASGLHQEAFEKVEGPRCANCCKTADVILSRADVERISAHLGLAVDAFIAAHLVPDGEGGYEMKAKPCPLLGPDDRCTIYDIRPEGCRG